MQLGGQGEDVWQEVIEEIEYEMECHASLVGYLLDRLEEPKLEEPENEKWISARVGQLMQHRLVASLATRST